MNKKPDFGIVGLEIHQIKYLLGKWQVSLFPRSVEGHPIACYIFDISNVRGKHEGFPIVIFSGDRHGTFDFSPQTRDLINQLVEEGHNLRWVGIDADGQPDITVENVMQKRVFRNQQWVVEEDVHG